MLLISNHLLSKKLSIPNDAIVRINIAWIKDIPALKKALDIDHDICVDFPEGRAKPPVPTISFYDVLQVIRNFGNVRYLAVSNIESGNIAHLFSQSLPEDVKFIPKIESMAGINNFDDIQEQCLPEHIMLDTEDLFTDVKGHIETYNLYMRKIREKCDVYKIKILNLAGVVFSD